MDHYLSAIIIDVEVIRLGANINGVKVSLRSTNVAPTWHGSAPSLLAPTPGTQKRPLILGSYVHDIYIYIYNLHKHIYLYKYIIYVFIYIYIYLCLTSMKLSYIDILKKVDSMKMRNTCKARYST